MVLVLSLSALGARPGAGVQFFFFAKDLCCLLEELEAPLLVDPLPLEPRERFGDWPRPRLLTLLRPSSIVLVVDHGEELGRLTRRGDHLNFACGRDDGEFLCIVAFLSIDSLAQYRASYELRLFSTFPIAAFVDLSASGSRGRSNKKSRDTRLTCNPQALSNRKRRRYIYLAYHN